MRYKTVYPPAGPEVTPEPEPPPTRFDLIRKRINRLYVRYRSVLLVLAGIFLAVGSMLIYEATQPPPQKLTQRDIDNAVARTLENTPPKPAFSSIVYEIIRPSMVRIRAVLQKTNEETEGALGSGVVIDDSGTIITNHHVIRDAVKIQVVFADGTESEADVIVSQPENDLAILRPKVIPDDLIPATLTVSDTLRIGDEVVAVGHPFGMHNSLTAGVVSGLGRNFKSHKTGALLTNLIQFDAAVNQGNSGGPLLNRNGEVVGIVTALLNPTDQDVFIGVGLAVPIESATSGLGSPPY